MDQNYAEKQQLGWLCFSRLPALHNLRGRRLLESCEGDILRLLNCSEQRLREHKIDRATCSQIADWVANGADSEPGIQARRDREWLEANNAALLHLGHPDYPLLLSQIHSAPLVLFTRGDATLLKKPQLAIVGGRKASIRGRENARRLAAELAGSGLVITSGLALGIDSAGHRGALYAGRPTVAVLATGLDLTYPRSNTELADEIAASGVLVSEYPLGSPPQRQAFPQRNRIISGLSLGVLVIEASLRSGSLITARHALSQNREIFALPGSVDNPLARGCNHLLRQGAKLVENSAHILEELEPLFNSRITAPRLQALGDDIILPDTKLLDSLPPPARKLFDNLGCEPTPVNLLIDSTGLSAATVAAELTELEVRGLVQQTAHGIIRL